MELLILFLGFIMLYFIIRSAIDSSDVAAYLKKNNILMQEILKELKEKQENGSKEKASEYFDKKL